MNNPFVFLDNKNKKLHIVINTLCKTIDFDNLEDNEDFLYELNRKFPTYDFFTHSQEIAKKDFKKLVEDIVESNKAVEERQVKEASQEKQDVEDESSSYIMSTTESKFFIEELGMEFKLPGDFYDLANYDEQKITKSKTFKLFLDKGWLKRASMSTINSVKEEHIKKKRQIKESRSMIIERDGAVRRSGVADSDDTMLIEGSDADIPKGGGRTLDGVHVNEELKNSMTDIVFGGNEESEAEKFLDPSLKRLLR